MGRNIKGIEVENSKADTVAGTQMRDRIERELSRSEIPKCDEKHDIRQKVVGGEPFTSSAGKRLKMEKTAIKGEFGEALSDANLHSDTTMPSECDITKAPQAKDTFAGSARMRQGMEHNGAKQVKETGKNKQMNS